MSHDHLIRCPIRTKTLHSGLPHLSDEVQKRNWNLKVSGDVESLMDALDILDIKPDGSTSERLTIAITHLSACLTMELSYGHPPLFPQPHEIVCNGD